VSALAVLVGMHAIATLQSMTVLGDTTAKLGRIDVEPCVIKIVDELLRKHVLIFKSRGAFSIGLWRVSGNIRYRQGRGWDGLCGHVGHANR